jgi:4-hydroxy-tetrahydrodipicolinate synthase
MNDRSRILKERVWHGLIPAVPVPFNHDRSIDHEAQTAYVKWMTTQPVAGVAVWVHTGRGLFLSDDQRKFILNSWREALPDKVIIAGAGGNPSAKTNEAYVESAIHMAASALALGADAILCHPPTRFRDHHPDERDTRVLEYHHALAWSGLPMMLFYLYEAAGGISYSDSLLSSLFAIPEVFGIKMATLDSVMTFQRVASLLAKHHPEQLLVTGEDRFLGYSVMMGAEAALIGMGAARTEMQHQMMQAYWNQEYAQFHKLSSKVDLFAGKTFCSPMEGYITRMLHMLAYDAVVPTIATFDPWGPVLNHEEFTALDAMLNNLDA